MARPRTRIPKAAPDTTPSLSSRQRILWLLKFLQHDIAALRPGELLDLRNDVFPYLTGPDLGTVTVFDADELRALGPVPPRRTDMNAHQVIDAARDYMASVQDQIRSGIEGLERTGTWWPFPLDRPAPHWSLERRADRTVQRAWHGAPSTITLAAAADLLVEWCPQLRRCKHESCGVLFLPRHRRQVYHDPACAFQKRWAKYASTRKRNYHEEYATRVRKVVGPGARPQRRKGSQ